jgi:hypothetical protein
MQGFLGFTAKQGMQTIILMHFTLHNSIWDGKVNARFFRVYCKARDVNQKFDAFHSA